MVFRSIWVPITAAAGYLLSIVASFGVVAAVFEWGWFADLLHVARTGPIISFMPIGTKLTIQLMSEMKRRGSKYGMSTMCIGGGMGAAGIFENLQN